VDGWIEELWRKGYVEFSGKDEFCAWSERRKK